MNGTSKPRPFEGDDIVVMFGHVPERGEQLGLIGARHKLDRSAFARLLLEILGQKQRLSAERLGIEHGNADDLGRERPEIELPLDFGPLGVAFRSFRQLFRLTEQVFLLRLVKKVDRQRGSIDVKNNGGHAGINRQDAGDAKKIFQICFYESRRT